jgi:hypothetical protein
MIGKCSFKIPPSVKITPRRQRLLDDAQKAGYSIEIQAHEIRITKQVRNKKKGLVIYVDGTAFDITVDIRVAKGIRSYRDMRAVLGIQPE